MLKSHENSVGAWAFLIGVILALVIGLFTTLLPIPALIKYSAYIYGILVLLGIVVGIMIVRGKDSQTVLIAGLIIVIVSQFGKQSVSGSLIGIGLDDMVSSIFTSLLALFVPATIIIALKTVFSIAKV
ncbi:MAG TPA: hypothetical protein VJ438_06590 [Candidatus Nanoarchaeia archaeon]|nr:hypothetical protein [Candidatus Nanoarchaeia archaeon]